MPNEKINIVGTNIAEKATMIWNVADVLRGPFKPHEYGLVILPMCIIKRFHDCLLPTHQAVLNALITFGVPLRYIEVIRQCNTGCFTDINLLNSPVRVGIQRGVRQGEVTSPKLFSAALELVMRNVELPCGIDIDGEKLQYLLFADDIILIGTKPCDLEDSLRILCEAVRLTGLQIHPGKTQWMKNSYVEDYSLHLEGSVIEEVSSYVYLGQAITMDNDLTAEISRRRKAGWAAFNKYRDVLTDKRLDVQTRGQVFNTHVLPALVYGCETWNKTRAEEDRLAVTQRAMCGPRTARCCSPPCAIPS